jgi:hypothetical protein
MDFGGIFGDLEDTLDDWLGAGKDILGNEYVQAGLGAIGQQRESAEKRAEKARSLLSSLDKGHKVGNRFEASKSDPVKSVDPLAFEAAWRDRLNNFLMIERQTGVKI